MKRVASSASGRVSVRREGRIAVVSLDHPGRLNAITVAMWQRLRQVFTELSEDDALRCVVIRGHGGHFAAGADIQEFPDYRDALGSVVHYHRDILAPALQAVAACVHPVIAWIEGACVGGGLEIAAQCDLRIAGSSARFGVPINRLGFPMAPDEMQGLLDLIGRAATLEILLEGRIFGAEEALAKGVLTRVVADDALQDDVIATARRIAGGAPLAARINKATVKRLAPRPTPLTEAELEYVFSYAESHDHQEGVAAFLAGREPRFSGD